MQASDKIGERAEDGRMVPEAGAKAIEEVDKLQRRQRWEARNRPESDAPQTDRRR